MTRKKDSPKRAKRPPGRPKSRGRLESDAFALEMQRDCLIDERDALKVRLEEAEKQFPEALVALGKAVQAAQCFSPVSFEATAILVAVFLLEVAERLDMDLTSTDTFYEIMGFDQVSAIAIKQMAPIIEEIAKMTAEGRSEEEIFRFYKEAMRKRGGGGTQ